MCEALFCIRTNIHPDPIKDRRGCYKRGMAPVAYEDGHTWGRDESKQVWIAEGRDPAQWPGQGVRFIMKLPGTPANTLREMGDVQMVDDGGIDFNGIYRRRQCHLQIDSLPPPMRNAILRDGEITSNRAQIKPLLIRLRDGAECAAGW